MFKSFNIPPKIEDLIKIIVSFKVLIFILVGATESFLVIKGSFLMDRCIDTMTERLNDLDEKVNSARATHFCEGGNVIDKSLFD